MSCLGMQSLCNGNDVKRVPRPSNILIGVSCFILKNNNDNSKNVSSGRIFTDVHFAFGELLLNIQNCSSNQIAGNSLFSSEIGLFALRGHVTNASLKQ